MKRTLVPIGCAMGPPRRKGPARTTERCERDFLRLVLCVSISNEIRERTATIEPSQSREAGRLGSRPHTDGPLPFSLIWRSSCTCRCLGISSHGESTVSCLSQAKARIRHRRCACPQRKPTRINLRRRLAANLPSVPSRSRH